MREEEKNEEGGHQEEKSELTRHRDHHGTEHGRDSMEDKRMRSPDRGRGGGGRRGGGGNGREDH